ncbi:AAA family ATPase [Patescibacteria group bacterium]
MVDIATQLKELGEQIDKSQTPDKLKTKIKSRLIQLEGLVESSTFLPEYDRITKYIDWVLRIPWQTKTTDILDLTKIRSELDSTHYGLESLKNRILEYVSVMKLKQEKGEEKEVFRAPILCFVGLVGTGKTTIAHSIAKSMGREYARIPFGGMGSPFDLRGQSRVHAEAEPGKIIKALADTGSRNPVVLLDEIDRVTDEGRSSIMGVLVELLDPSQNNAFVDHYVDFPVDLSEVMFIATANNTRHIATAVLDRIEPISMPSYSDQEKITIAKKYMLPKILKTAGISPGDFVIEEDVWPTIVRPLGFDSGMRTLERGVGAAVRKAAKLAVEGKQDKLVIDQSNVKEFLPQ